MVLRSALVLAALPLLSCVSHEAATSQTEGEVHLTSTAPTGAAEAIDIVTPDGDVYVELEEWGDHCELSVNATSPVASDLTTAGEAHRVRLLVGVRDTEMPDLLAGKAQQVTAHAGVLAADCTVRLEQNRGSASVYDQWCSTGGTLAVDPLPAVGGTFRMTLSDLALVATGGSETQEGRLLAGTVEATLRSTKRMSSAGTGTTCPQ